MPHFYAPIFDTPPGLPKSGLRSVPNVTAKPREGTNVIYWALGVIDQVTPVCVFLKVYSRREVPSCTGQYGLSLHSLSGCDNL